MSTQELLIYIHNEIELNVSRDQITTHLLAAGMKEDIERAFHELDKADGSSINAVVFSDPQRNGYHWKRLGRRLVVCVLCIVIAFTAFSIAFNLGYIGPSLQSENAVQKNTDQNSPQIDIQNNVIDTNASTVIASPALVPTNTVISQSDKDQITSAILTQNTVFQSGDAAGIKNYLSIGASTDYSRQLSAMSDRGILSLASTMLSGIGSVGADVLNSPQTVWQQIDPSTVKVTIQTSSGPVTRTAHEVNGVWY